MFRYRNNTSIFDILKQNSNGISIVTTVSKILEYVTYYLQCTIYWETKFVANPSLNDVSEGLQTDFSVARSHFLVVLNSILLIGLGCLMKYWVL